MNVAVLGVIVLLVAASLFFTFIAPGTDPNSVDPVAIGCGVGLIVVGLVMGAAAVRDRGAGWMVALSLVGVLIALPLMAIVPSQRDQVADYSGAQVGVQVEPSEAEYDWTTSGFSEVGGASLNLVDAPASTDKKISVDDTMGDLTVHVRQGQSVAFRIDGTTGEVSAQYYEGPGATTSEPWVPAVSYVSDSLYFRSDGYRPGAAITVAISGSVGNITIIEEAPSTDTSTGAQSGDPQSGDAQSGDAQSGTGKNGKTGKTGNQKTGDTKSGNAKTGTQSKEDAR